MCETDQNNVMCASTRECRKANATAFPSPLYSCCVCDRCVVDLGMLVRVLVWGTAQTGVCARVNAEKKGRAWLSPLSLSPPQLLRV